MSAINTPIIDTHLMDEQFQRSSQMTNNSYATFPQNCIVIGLGGIGSNVGTILGSIKNVNNIILFDDDVVDLTNLPRTVYQYRHEGQPKVEAMAEIISSRNIGPNVYPINKKFNEELCDIIKNDDTLDFIQYNDFMVFDCRDDYFGDYGLFESISERENQFTIIRAAYNKMNITIDPNPAIHPVWGHGGYNENTASHSIPAKLSAMLVVMVASQYKQIKKTPMFKIPLTFDVNNTLDFLFKLMMINKLSDEDKIAINNMIDSKINNVYGNNTTRSEDNQD